MFEHHIHPDEHMLIQYELDADEYSKTHLRDEKGKTSLNGLFHYLITKGIKLFDRMGIQDIHKLKSGIELVFNFKDWDLKIKKV